MDITAPDGRTLEAIFNGGRAMEQYCEARRPLADRIIARLRASIKAMEENARVLKR